MSPTPCRYAGVVFDMDGVLCDSEPLTAQAACQMFAETHNLRIKPADFKPFMGAGDDRYLGGVAEKFGVKLALARDKKRFFEIYLKLIRGKLQPLPGVREFIDACRQKDIRMAIATSAGRVKLDGHMKTLGLPALAFHTLVSGSDITANKPDPQIFLTAAARMMLPAAQCLVIEDSPPGVQAAKAAGARCLAVTTTFPAEALQAAGADWIAPDLGHADAGKL